MATFTVNTSTDMRYFNTQLVLSFDKVQPSFALCATLSESNAKQFAVSKGADIYEFSADSKAQAEKWVAVCTRAIVG